jgi:uncharacterized protein (TIGR03437 family)
MLRRVISLTLVSLTLAAARAAADSVPNLKLNPLPSSVLIDPSKISVQKIGTMPFITSWGSGTPTFATLHFAGRGDLNGDGIEDLVIAGWTFVGASQAGLNPPAPVFFVLSTPNGYVVKQGKELGIESVPGTTQIYISDFNGDGRADIFFAGYHDFPVLAVPSVMAYQQSDGTFRPQPTIEKIASHNGDSVDLNGDGRPDLILATYRTSDPTAMQSLVYYESTGLGLRLHRFDTAGPFGGSAVTAGDYHRTGLPSFLSLDASSSKYDIIESNAKWDAAGNALSFLGNVIGTPFFDRDPAFATATSFFTNKSHDICARTLDFDRDGFPDLVMASMIWSNQPYAVAPNHAIISLWRSAGNVFVDETEKRLWNFQVTAREPQHTLDIVDINGDGYPDILGGDPPVSTLNPQTGHYELIPGTGGNEVLVNDGTGNFVSVLWKGFDDLYLRAGVLVSDHSALNPSGAKFFPLPGPHGELQWVTYVEGYWDSKAGAFKTDWFLVDAGRVSTGPGLQDPASQGAPGFSEAYYLTHNPDVRDLVASGRYASGLAHYVAAGKFQGRTINAASQPTIAVKSVNVAGGGPDIAPNTWIEIKGVNLAPSNAPERGLLWDHTPELASGRMPAGLNGVRVTVGGKSAYVWFYCSAATSPSCKQDQINVLTPPDLAAGPVQIVVANGGIASAPFPVNVRTVAPSFLHFGATNYVVAQHGGYSLLGPLSMSAPGYPFTPAAPGEPIILYGVGFGVPPGGVAAGSLTQSGVLPSLPSCTLGGRPAAILFAGLISPGLYQINLGVPNPMPAGDADLNCTYGGSQTSASVIPVGP